MYDNTSQPYSGDEPMRNMLMHFIGFQMDILLKMLDFKNLLGGKVEILYDFCSMVERRIKNEK